jgi:hypothetical protein
MEVSKTAEDTSRSDKATGKAGICGVTTAPQRLLERLLQSQGKNADNTNGCESTCTAASSALRSSGQYWDLTPSSRGGSRRQREARVLLSPGRTSTRYHKRLGQEASPASLSPKEWTHSLLRGLLEDCHEDVRGCKRWQWPYWWACFERTKVLRP